MILGVKGLKQNAVCMQYFHPFAIQFKLTFENLQLKRVTCMLFECFVSCAQAFWGPLRQLLGTIEGKFAYFTPPTDDPLVS